MIEKEGARIAMFLRRISCAAAAGGLFIGGAVVVGQQSGGLPDPLPAPAPRSRDAVDDRAAVAKELAQLDVDLLDEEVKAIRSQLSDALKNRVQYETSLTTVDPRAWQDADAAYRKARSVLVEKTRALATAKRKVGKPDEPKAETKAKAEEPHPAAVGSVNVGDVLDQSPAARRPGALSSAIAAVAAEKGFDYVVRSDTGAAADRSILYANPRNDITADVVRELSRLAEPAARR